MRLLGPSSSSTTLALLTLPTLASGPASSSSTAAALHSPSSSFLPLPPFNATDSRLVVSCALRAQQKQRRNQSLAESRGVGGGWSLWARLGGMGPAEQDAIAAHPPPLTGLPIRQTRYEHAHRRGALFCRTGNWLQFVGGDTATPAQVRGARQHSGRFTIFEFLAVAFGLVSIRAVSSRHFLCMDSFGQLYAAPESQYSAECVFMEEMHPQVYNLYSSCAHGTPKRPWFVALGKTGRQRRGRNTRKGQKSAHFVLVEGSGGGGGGEGPNRDGGQQPTTLLDSLGHAQTRADWLVHWKNFYEVHERRRKKARKPIGAKGKSGGRLRWEIQRDDDGGGKSELRRKRRRRRKMGAPDGMG